MRRIFLTLTALFFIISEANSISFNLEFTFYKNDTAKIDLIEISELPESSFDEFVPGDYKIALLSKSGELLWEKSTVIEMVLEPEIGGEEPFVYESRDFFWRLPYLEEAEKIRFSKKDITIFEINLPEKFCIDNDKKCHNYCESRGLDKDCFSCGDGLCSLNFGENFGNCKQDCKSGSKDNFCDKEKDNICDPDCKTEEDFDCFVNKGTPPYMIYYIIAVVGLIFLILFLIFWAKGKREPHF
jgi:hypothetical protein